MAGYKEHIGFSGVLGLFWGIAATWGFGFTPVQGSIVFLLTWFSGMLPDIDSQTGRPVREIFGVVSVIGPLIMMQHLLAWGGDPERILLIVILFYIALRNFGPPLLGKLCVHRGMYHSVPALLIACLTTFLFYKHENVEVRLLMASGVSIGFLSHLILDEIYSVQWTGARIKLAKSAGSALKWFGHSMTANAFCWAAVMFLGYLALSDVGLIVDPNTTAQQEEQTIELDDAQTDPFEEGLLPENPEAKHVELGAGTDAPFFQ